MPISTISIQEWLWRRLKDNHKTINPNEVKLKWVTFIHIDSYAFTVFFNKSIYVVCQWHSRRLSSPFTSDKPKRSLAIVTHRVQKNSLSSISTGSHLAWSISFLSRACNTVWHRLRNKVWGLWHWLSYILYLEEGNKYSGDTRGFWGERIFL